jgi:hypothetical protein
MVEDGGGKCKNSSFRRIRRLGGISSRREIRRAVRTRRLAPDPISHHIAFLLTRLLGLFALQEYALFGLSQGHGARRVQFLRAKFGAALQISKAANASSQKAISQPCHAKWGGANMCHRI